MNFSKVELVLTKSGVCRGVILDGVRIEHVSSAEVVPEPGGITKLHLTVYVSTVETKRHEEG